MKILFELLYSFFKIGSFTFGGGYAMVPLIQKEIVENKKWISKDEFIELLALAQSVPGAIAINSAIFVGYRLKKSIGSVAALLGIVIPSFIIILAIAMFFADFKDNPTVNNVFKGMRPAVVALIVTPIYNLAKGMGWYKIAIAIIGAFIVWFLGVSPVYLIIIGAVAGFLYGIYRKEGVE